MIGNAGARPAWRGRVVACALAGLLLGGCATPTPAPPISLAGVPAAQRGRAESNVRVFERVWSLVADHHYDATLHGVDWPAAGRRYGAEAAAAGDDRALYATLNALVGLLHDSHTEAYSPQEARERRTERGVRVGISWRRVEGRPVVDEVRPGSPAEQAGVKVGWILVARNGMPAGSHEDLKLPDGEPLVFDFLDEGDRPVRVSVQRRPISIAARQVVRELDGGFVYLRFDEFNGKGMHWLSGELKKHAAAPGAVIDLRRNPGGVVYSLEFGVGEFFDHAVELGTDISRDGGRDGTNSWQFASAQFRGKVAVLVDRMTASSGEIFSAVLQEHGRAIIVGRRTAGAVQASSYYSLPDGGELQLSLTDYVTPHGRRLEGAGVTPDVPVAARFDSIAGLRAGRDLDLAAALAALKTDGTNGATLAK